MIAFFLIPLFSIFATDGSHMVYMSTDIDYDCNHVDVNGCLATINGKTAVIVEDPFRPDERGCNTLTHEWLHLMGLKEHELPYCVINQEFR